MGLVLSCTVKALAGNCGGQVVSGDEAALGELDPAHQVCTVQMR